MHVYTAQHFLSRPRDANYRALRSSNYDSRSDTDTTTTSGLRQIRERTPRGPVFLRFHTILAITITWLHPTTVSRENWKAILLSLPDH